MQTVNPKLSECNLEPSSTGVSPVLERNLRISASVDPGARWHAQKIHDAWIRPPVTGGSIWPSRGRTALHGPSARVGASA